MVNFSPRSLNARISRTVTGTVASLLGSRSSLQVYARSRQIADRCRAGSTTYSVPSLLALRGSRRTRNRRVLLVELFDHFGVDLSDLLALDLERGRDLVLLLKEVTLQHPEFAHALDLGELRVDFAYRRLDLRDGALVTCDLGHATGDALLTTPCARLFLVEGDER